MIDSVSEIPNRSTLLGQRPPFGSCHETSTNKAEYGHNDGWLNRVLEVFEGLENTERKDRCGELAVDLAQDLNPLLVHLTPPPY